MSIVGREEEVRELSQFLSSNTSEFLAIYGRRRVGKTFLIRHFFQKQNALFFNVTGAKDVPLKEQISHFTKEIGNIFYKGASLTPPKNWDAAFESLTEAFKMISKTKKIVLFFDEFPWLVTKNSRLLQTLEYYWNHYWSQDKRIKLIICGSSASWIIEKIINNKGGLYNRITRTIYLEPFNLKSTKVFLNSLNIRLTNAQILQIYMVLGGIPYYLSKIEKGLSAIENIERLAFRRNGFLLEEFDNLFFALFEDAEIYIQIIRLIAKHRYGIGQEDLLTHLGKSYQGENGLKKLKALQDANFILRFKSHFQKKKGFFYRLVDEYTLFYLDWIEPIRETLKTKSLIKGYWEQISQTPRWRSWSGYAFESVCYKHIPQISKTLKIPPTSLPDTWRYVPSKNMQDEGAQIDLLFDRTDDSITLCEIKYTQSPFILDKLETSLIQKKISIFKKKTQTKKQIFLAFITANGLKKTMYSEEIVDGVVVLDNLFEKA